MNNQDINSKPKLAFYEKTWFIIVMMIVLPPAGIFLMWFFKEWSTPIKIVLSIVLIFYCSIYFGVISA